MDGPHRPPVTDLTSRRPADGTQEAISGLNASVDLDEEDPADVAAAFLKDDGLTE